MLTARWLRLENCLIIYDNLIINHDIHDNFFGELIFMVQKHFYSIWETEVESCIQSS